MAPREKDSMPSDESGGYPQKPDVDQHKPPLLEACRHLLKPNGSILGREVAEAILPQFPTFCSAIPQQDQQHAALASIDGRLPLSHGRIYDFCVNEFGPMIHALGFGKGDRIALVLPNGPELALAIVATAHWSSCVPLSANGSLSELESDLVRCGADLIIGPYSGPLTREKTAMTGGSDGDSPFAVMTNNGQQDWSAFQCIEESAAKLSIPFVGLVPSPREAGIFRLKASRSMIPLDYFDHQDKPLASIRREQKHILSQQPNGACDEVLVLFTSGTTGNKKLVPHQLDAMLTAAATISLSWALKPSDVNCNLMPLFHVGGIVRQVFSPIFSGGCVICCPSFDPSIFWALMENNAFSWYYASPTMHHIILQTGKDEGFIGDGGQCAFKLRMIANAAGGLLPSLAEEMLRTFDANILPSYGMSECMPISSPPATYRLEKPGTSGVPVGPEVAILDLITSQELPVGTEGPICVRGYPCFRGYGKIANEPAVTNDSFLKGGWFNTGDLGCLDSDGYLYITGRSKEVINRGGEIISPMEVEEAVTSHPDVASCAAFSALHNVLQEVVGTVIVMKKDHPRIDLVSLHEFLGDRLAAPKWPQCIVFMDGLPKSHTNKLLRVKLGNRLQLPELSDEMTTLERTFEATCPPQGTALDVVIPSRRVVTVAADIQETMTSLLATNQGQRVLVVDHPTRAGSFVCYLVQIDRVAASAAALKTLNRYSIPSHFIETSETDLSSLELPPPIMMDSLASILQGEYTGQQDPVLSDVQELISMMLNLDFLPGSDANFFHLGGSSMLASQLASKIRKQYEIPCSGSEIFQQSSPGDIAKLIRMRSDEYTTSTVSLSSGSQGSWNKDVSDHGAPFESKRLAPENTLLSSIFQLVPMFLIFPIWQVTRYLIFFCLLLWSIDNVPGERDLRTFVFSYLAFHTLWVTLAPLIFVAIKWIVIGRYRAGRYPIYSAYYLRWWFVDICRKLFLRGIWGSHHVLLNTYYRLLGAKIGKGARISLECELAEYDLVEVGSDAAVEMSTLRGFGVDNGTMILGPVCVGTAASVGIKSVVAPYTSVAANCHLGAATSSYEVGGKALEPKHARVNRQCLPEPHLWMEICVIGPISFLVNAFGQIPPLAVLFLMLQYKGVHDVNFETLGDLMAWLCDPHRIQYYIGIRIARTLFSPFFYMAAALFVKKTIIGTFQAGPRDTEDQWQLVRHALAATLFSRKKIQSVTDLVGRHYELVSCLYRLLGAKVGQRVFWPGNQPIFSPEFDLLDIGDDVVFGSRSAILFSTATSCEKVILCAGSNVADNCVVFPGSILGKNAVLGSNSVCPEGWYLPEQSVWLGSRGGEPTCLEKGHDPSPVTDLKSASEVPPFKLEMMGDASTLRPFGKAFYRKEAPYFVWPLEMIIAYTVCCKTFIAAFHTLPLLGAIHGAAVVLYGWSMDDRDYLGEHHSFTTVYFMILGCYIVANFCRVVLWLTIELTAKWTLLGKRAEGRYNYDSTSYAQRWELYQTIAKIRKFSRLNFLDFFSGTPFLSAYFRWNGGSIGRNCCLYPAGADPFMPEPDLVEIGDHCVVDCASIVCHLNTRGNFELAKIVLGENCTLRCRSRVQQAVCMEEGSQLLEKSLAMTGEVIEAYSVWQGSPASSWFKYEEEDTEKEDECFYDESSKLLQGSNNTTSFYV